VVDAARRSVLVKTARDVRRPAAETECSPAPVLEPAGSSAHASQKEHYRFEREHLRACGVAFSDIQGFSTKAQELSSLEISTLIQEYENILLPIMEAHQGILVKRMGDGHLFTFAEPLPMVLAAIRVQKALSRFNRFRPEKLRVMVRIGLHWGEVVEKARDVFGNTVNIASRLQSVARPGSVCISHVLYELTAEWIHAVDLGPVTVKGMREPIHAWEPTEVSLELPAARDPLKRPGAAEGEPPSAAPAQDAVPASLILKELLGSISDAFAALRRAGKECAASKSAAAKFEAELVRCWNSLKPVAARLNQRLYRQGRQ
jgi:class 3 adenylate cyclase